MLLTKRRFDLEMGVSVSALGFGLADHLAETLGDTEHAELCEPEYLFGGLADQQESALIVTYWSPWV